MADTLPARSHRSVLMRIAVAMASVVAVLVGALVLVGYRVRLVSFMSGSRLVALIPGAFGIYVRRYWYRRTLDACGPDLVVDWLTTFKTPSVRVGRDVFIGAMGWIAEADLGDHVMIATRVAVQGGGNTHNFDRTDIPISQQGSAIVKIVIGRDAWIGTGATILANVASGTVVGAGSVVTKEFPERSVIAGVPARVIRMRSEKSDVRSQNVAPDSDL
jgi:virginiamycin A acetyltransferase